jgi:hypothetical protein
MQIGKTRVAEKSCYLLFYSAKVGHGRAFQTQLRPIEGASSSQIQGGKSTERPGKVGIRGLSPLTFLTFVFIDVLSQCADPTLFFTHHQLEFLVHTHELTRFFRAEDLKLQTGGFG